jgi:YkoY family integral membrane protein
MFGQTFEFHDIAIVGLLVVLEGVLSIDNALVLGLLARRLPKHEQKKALTYGLVGAFAFRLIAIALAAYLLHWHVVKLLGGAYLVYVSLKHFFFDSPTPHPTDQSRGLGMAKFWPTVLVIELTDIAFAVDSIVAAFGTVGDIPDGTHRHPKLWVIVIGGFLGVILMRFAAVIFIRLLERFPRFEMAAYFLVIVIGGKLVVDWATDLNFHSPSHAAFWVFWGLMFASFGAGFLPAARRIPNDQTGMTHE